MAIVYRPGEHEQQRESNKMKAVSCLLVLAGTVFIYITDWWIGMLLIWFGIHDLIFGKHSILKKPQRP